MKTITKFLTLVLSLFCVFGMISPVYAEGEDKVTIINAYNESGESVAYNYLDKGQTYTFEVNGNGKTDLDSTLKIVEESLNNAEGLSYKMGESSSTSSSDGTYTWQYKFTATPSVSGASYNINFANGVTRNVTVNVAEDDPPVFVKYSLWNDKDNKVVGDGTEVESNKEDAYDYTLSLNGDWYGISFNWKGALKSSGQTRLDKFTATGYFETVDNNEYGSTLTTDGKATSYWNGWEYFRVKPTKVGTTTVEVFEGKPITFHIVDGSETATDEEAVQKTTESIEWMKKNIFNCLDNKASREYVSEIIASEIKYDYTNVGPDYGTTIEIVDFNLVKATQTESGSISFTVKISKGDSSASIDYSNTLAPVPTPEIKSLTVHSQNPFGEVLPASDGYHLDAGTSYTICLTYIGDVEVNVEKTFTATKAFDACSSNAGSDGYSSIYDGIDDFAGITPTTNGTYELELVPGTKRKFIVTGGKEPDKLVPEISENSPTTTVSSDVDVIVENTKASYSTEQQEALTEGGSADVKVSVSKIIPSDEDKKLVEAQLNSTNKIAMYLDLAVRVSVKNKDGNKVGEDVTVSETGTPVKFTVALDDSFINTKNTVDRTYQVVRIHNGVVDVLPATFDADSKTITFETDKFSTYAVMYTDTPKASKTPATADGMNVALYGGVAVISVLAVGLLFFFKKRNA